MRLLYSLIPPVVKGIVAAVAFMVGLGWGAYSAVLVVARTEAASIESKVMAVRNADFGHINKRFDETQGMIKELRHDILSKRRD